MSATAAVPWRKDWQVLEDHFPERSLAHLTGWSRLLAGDLSSVPSELLHRRSHTVSFPHILLATQVGPVRCGRGATKPSSEGHRVASWRLVARLYIGSMADEVPGAGNFQNPSKSVFFLNPQSEAFKICPAILGTWERSRGLSQRGQNLRQTSFYPYSTFPPNSF